MYGDYVRPYGSFRWLIQPELRSAYLTRKPRPIRFQIGYGFRHAPSNLIFATRVEQVRTSRHAAGSHASKLEITGQRRASMA